jgi:hypothetical protein
MSQIIHFKETPDLGQFLSVSLNSSAIALVYYMAFLAWSWWGKELTITDIHRDDDPAGTHKNWHAIDVRNANFSRQEALKLAGAMNGVATYDPARPTMKICLVYDLDPHGKHDDHFHLQVHENTVFKEVQDD